MSPILSAAAVLIAMLLIYRMILSSGSRWTPFNPARARTAIRKPAGGNALLILAAVNIAALGYQIAAQAAAGGPTIATVAGILLPPLILLAIAGLVLSRDVADLLLGLLGIAAALLDAYLGHGLPGLLIVLTLTMLILFLLGALRGLTGRRR